MDRKPLKIWESAYREVVQHAAAAWPREACGALLGTTADAQEILCEAMPAQGPLTITGTDFFRIGAPDMVAFHARATLRRWQILGFYHSHPNGSATPSRADLPRPIGDLAASGGATWPEHCLLIASVQNRACHEVRAYRLTTAAGASGIGNLQYEALELDIIVAHPSECDQPECDPPTET